MRARRRGLAAVLLAGATGMGGIGSMLWFTALPAAAFTAPVDAANRTFSPELTRIELGDRVLWRNREDADDKTDGAKHSVTSDSGSERFDYALGTRGATAERRFDKAGTYTYHCKFHPEMTGTVEVVDPAATTTSTAPTTTSTAPPTTTTTAPSTTTTGTPSTTAPSTTTTTAARPGAAVPLPPVPSSAAAAPPTLATSSTTTVPSTTTTVPPTTASSAPPTTVADPGAPPASAPPSPPSTEATPDTGDEVPTAAGPISRGDGKLDAPTVTLISLLVAVGLFGTWTLIRIRPGRI